MGTAGAAIMTAKLRPGDKLAIVFADDGAAATGASPRDASEVMVFRNVQAR